MARKSTRTYNLTDADLIQFSDSIVRRGARDAVAFLSRKVTADRWTAITEARDEFADFPTDEEYLGDFSTATEEKTVARGLVEGTIRIIRNMAQVQWGTSGYYTTFGFDKTANTPDAVFYRAARRIVRMATRFASKLGSQGLTPELLTLANQRLSAFEAAMTAQEMAAEDRVVATVERSALGDKLYKMVSEVCSIGRSLFEEEPSKYNDYLLPS